jgi:hypothetical protein
VTVYFTDSSFSALVMIRLQKRPFAIEQSGRATVHLTAAPKRRRLIAAARSTGLETRLSTATDVLQEDLNPLISTDARAVSVHAAAPASTAMNSRRLMRGPPPLEQSEDPRLSGGRADNGDYANDA